VAEGRTFEELHALTGGFAWTLTIALKKNASFKSLVLSSFSSSGKRAMPPSGRRARGGHHPAGSAALPLRHRLTLPGESK
jgi:hypothetical protein